MPTEARDLKIGLFILAAAALLIAGLLLFGGARFFQKTVTEETYVMGNVNGLDVGAPVTLRGVRVGKVTDISFTWYPPSSPGFVRILFAVRSDIYPVRGKALAQLIQTQVRQGLRARVQTQGLIGTPLLALEYVNPAQFPPPPLPRQPRYLYVPSAPSQFNQLLASMEQSLQKLSKFDLEKLSASLDRDLVTLDSLLTHINAVQFDQIGTNANALLTELRSLTVQWQTLIADFNGTVNRMDLAKLSHNANALLLHLQATVRQLDLTLGTLNISGLNETLANFRRASLELEQTLRELKQYPSGFLFGQPPPRATAVEPPAQ